MIPWRRDRLPTPVFLGFPGGSAEKESACNAEDLGLMPGLGRSPGEGKGHLFQYSGLENPVDCVVFNQIVWGFPLSSAGKESACNAGVPGLIPALGQSPGEGIGYPHQYSWASLVAQLVKNPPAMRETWVRCLGWEDPLEKGAAALSSTLAWRILDCVVHGHRTVIPPTCPVQVSRFPTSSALACCVFKGTPVVYCASPAAYFFSQNDVLEPSTLVHAVLVHPLCEYAAIYHSFHADLEAGWCLCVTHSASVKRLVVSVTPGPRSEEMTRRGISKS